MIERNKIWILLLAVLFLVGVGIYFSDFFKVVLGVTGNAVKIIG